jgi:predicted nucleic acid-binding protein
MIYVLDTTVLIDVLRNRGDRRKLLDTLASAGHTMATTVLNIAEVYAGMRKSEQRDTEALLAGLVWLELTASAARRGGELNCEWARKGRTLPLADTLIAAMAIEQGAQLMTDNRKDFPMAELDLFALP